MKVTKTFLESLDQRVISAYPILTKFALDICGTPMIELPSPLSGATIWGKCEFDNNANKTIKDRVAFAMTYSMLKDSLSTGKVVSSVIEYSGGGLGLSLAKLCKNLDLEFNLVVSEATPSELLEEIRFCNAKLTLVPKNKGFWGVMEVAKELAVENPDWYFMYQHKNPANIWMHTNTTGEEIVYQLPEQALNSSCAWVASIGTGGTLVGVRNALVKHIPHLLSFATTPAELSYGSLEPPNGLPKFSGSGGLGNGRRQYFVESQDEYISAHFHISYQEAIEALSEFESLTKLKVCSSAAANWLAAWRVAEQMETEANVITVLPSIASPTEWSKAIASQNL